MTLKLSQLLNDHALRKHGPVSIVIDYKLCGLSAVESTNAVSVLVDKLARAGFKCELRNLTATYITIYLP